MMHLIFVQYIDDNFIYSTICGLAADGNRVSYLLRDVDCKECLGKCGVKK